MEREYEVIRLIQQNASCHIITDCVLGTMLPEYLEEHGIVLGSADETVEARMPTPEIRRELFTTANRGEAMESFCCVCCNSCMCVGEISM